MAGIIQDTFTETEIEALITENSSGFTKNDAIELDDDVRADLNSKINNLESIEEAIAASLVI